MVQATLDGGVGWSRLTKASDEDESTRAAFSLDWSGSKVGPASRLNGLEPTRTALNCTVTTCAKLFPQLSTFAGPNWQILGRLHAMIVDQ